MSVQDDNSQNILFTIKIFKMRKSTNCSCSGEFDAEIAYARLTKKYDALVDTIGDYFANMEVGDPHEAARSGRVLAEYIYRIVGGMPVQPGEYPECCLVGELYSDGGISWFCTGVLIHPRLVLTARHCVKPNHTFVVGLNTINQNVLSTAEKITVKKVVAHNDYDMAVLVLSQEAQTRPVAIATVDETNDSGSVTLVGFGSDSLSGTIGFGRKRVVTTTINSMRRAVTDDLDADEIRYQYESDYEFVAGGGGHDSCNGDSGGPAYISVNGVLKVAGLTSRPTKGYINPCGEGGIYTRVDGLQDFVNGILGV
jgi:endonuclease G